MSQDWEGDSEEEEEEGNGQDREEENISVCLHWDVDLEEQDRKIKELEDQKNNEGKIPQNSPTFLSATSSTLKLTKSPIKQLGYQSSASPDVEVQKFDTPALGHGNKETFEEIN